MCIRDRRRVHGDNHLKSQQFDKTEIKKKGKGGIKMEVEQITLTAKDGTVFKVDSRIRKLSNLIDTVFTDSGDPNIPIQLDAAILQKVIDYCQAHNFNPPPVKTPLKSNDLQKNLDEKDYNFVKGYTNTSIKDLVNAAYYLQMNSLKRVCLCRIATDFVIGNESDSIAKLKKQHGINADDDMTLEEENQLLTDNPWLNEVGVDERAEEQDIKAQIMPIPNLRNLDGLEHEFISLYIK
eukprot:TRINITY_DN644_c0_g1_i6.p2 TRINITY_DN644_c0_g1~~TRINITY_DN644_c0_g1_i6.p2  ORF type:complete len:237 (+),score=96.66 TRINITY_DN644_c0_g1_i6:65-775(+)